MTKAALETALDVADRLGWFVFPIKKDHKSPPLLSNGRNGASNDVAQIARWGTEFPGANLGVATGLESGVGAVDLDGDEGENWFDSQWFDEGAVIETPSGGKHVYYSLVDETEYKSSIKEIHHEVDTRFEGGYAVLPGSHTIEVKDPETGRVIQHEGTYFGDLSEIPDLPAAVADVLPLRYYRPEGDEKVYLDVSGKPAERSLGEERVLGEIAKMLDELPRPWIAGAGYHDVMFRAACWLWGIVQSPDYSMTEKQAEEFYYEHSPKTNPATKARDRWESAREKTDGHPAEPPGDVPPLLDPNDILDPEKYPEVDRLYWETKKRSELDLLIRECRRSGLTEQQAYSLATASKANHLADGRRATSQFGRTRRVYNEVVNEATEELAEQELDIVRPEPGEERRKAEEKSLRGVFLSPAEREMVDRVPNFIDLYIEVAKAVYKEPNLPLAYLNAWMSLSALGCERGYLALKQGRRPLNFYGLLIADSGSGKGEMRQEFTDVISSYPGGISSLASFGRKPTAEAMEKTLIERNGKSALLMVDEAGELLRAFHNPKGSYMSGVLDMVLETYDGTVTQSARVGHEEEDRGKTVKANLNVWLQGTYEGITGELTEADIQSGLIGRFIPAIGWSGNFTEDSLSMEWADEYQIAFGGKNPVMDALGGELMAAFNELPPGGVAVVPANKAVNDRMTRFRIDVKNHIDRHAMHKELNPIAARLGVNAMKAAALIALSNGRAKVEMTDLLVALKSAEYWLGSMMQLCTAVVSGDFRKKVARLVELIEQRSRTVPEILRSKFFNNLTTGEIEMLLTRAEQENSIERDGQRWKKRERKK